MVGRWAIAVVVGVLVLAGCRVDATTTVTMADDGSGLVMVEVVLDREAFLRVGDLGRQLRVDDLEEAGWVVTGPEATEDQGRRLVAEKAFADPAEGTAVLAEITGGDGALRAPVLKRDKKFGRVEQGFEATLDLAGGIETFSDDDLTDLLGGLPIGQDVAALEEELGAPLSELTSFTVVVDLPTGDVSTAGDPELAETENRRVFTWEGALGDQPVELGAETSELDWRPFALAAVAVGAGLVLLVILIRRPWRRRGPAAAGPPPVDSPPDDVEPDAESDADPEAATD
jgi:hypothetical protein